jgi:hypothetical protein
MRNFFFDACLTLLLCDGGILKADEFAPPPAFSSPVLLTLAGHHRSLFPQSARVPRRRDGGDAETRGTPRAAAAAAAAREISPDDYDLLPPEDEDAAEVVVAKKNREAEATDLKRRLLAVAASYDRGFGATPAARESADDIIRRLAALNPTKEGASRGINGGAPGSGDDGGVPLRGVWRMIWTSAFDVVSLGASPFAGERAVCSVVFLAGG